MENICYNSIIRFQKIINVVFAQAHNIICNKSQYGQSLQLYESCILCSNKNFMLFY